MRDRIRRLGLVIVGVLLVTAPPLLAATGFNTAGRGGTLSASAAGPTVELGQDYEIAGAAPADGQTLDLRTQNHGNVTVNSTADTRARLNTIEGPWTNLSAVNSSAGRLSVNPDDKQQVGIEGTTSATVQFRSVGVEDGTVDLRYAGSRAATLTVHGLPAATPLLAVNDSGSVLATASSDASGVASFSVGAGTHDVRIVRNDGGPSVANGSANPSGGQTLGTTQVQFAIDVSDPDLPDDELTVTFYVDGQPAGTATTSSNGTVSLTEEVPTSGDHTWYAVVEDAHGNTERSATFDFGIPDSLQIRNESNPSQLVKNVTVELTFYYQGGTQNVRRTTTNGTINMTGLPAGQPFVATARADNYTSRRVYVERLTETQRIYLLPSDKPAREIIFTLSDFSGDFPGDETVLLVQRSINGTWQTVLGDYFGATDEYRTQLRYNERHRLVLLNTETGQQRILGPYTPLVSTREELRILSNGTTRIRGIGAVVSVAPSTRAAPASQTDLVEVTVENQSTSFAWWNVTFFVGNNTTTTQLYSVNRSRPAGGTINPSLNLSGWAGGTLSVRTQWQTTDGASGSETHTFRVAETFANGDSFFGNVGTISTLVDNPDQFGTFVAMLTTVLGMGALAHRFRLGTEALALAGSGILAGWALVGWVPMRIVFVAGVAAVTLAFVRRGL